MIVLIFAAASLTHGLTLQCDFENKDFHIVGVAYSCNEAALISDGNSTHVIKVTGRHYRKNNNNDVRVLYISSTPPHVNRISKGIVTFFPNLTVFAWGHGSLTILTADDLEPFPELQAFYVNDNRLVSLDEKLFKNTPKLRLVNFEFNLLKHVDFGLLDSLNNLTRAEFEYNPCINVKAETPAAIQELKFKLQSQCQPFAKTEMTTKISSTSSTLAVFLSPFPLLAVLISKFILFN